MNYGINWPLQPETIFGLVLLTIIGIGFLIAYKNGRN